MFETVSKAKVRDYNIAVAIKEKVFELQVSMDDFLLVNVPNTRNELGEELCSISFFEIAVGKDVVEEFSTRSIFKDDTNVFVGFDDIVKPHDVRMFERLGTKPVSRRRKKKRQRSEP